MTNLNWIYEEDLTSSLPTYFSPSVLMTSPSLQMESISPEKSVENKKGK